MWFDFFDSIQLINLPTRRDRYWISTWELSKYNIPYQVVRAIQHPDGREGLYQTVRSIFEKALASTCNRLLLFEDDLKFVRDPGPVMEKCIQQLPADFDMLYLGCNLAERPTGFFADNLLRVNRALSSHAVVYSRSCMERILSLPKILPIDILYVHAIQPAGKSFCACPLLVTQYPGFSDIERKETDWTNVLDRRFEENTQSLLKNCQHEHSQCCRA